MEEKSIYELVYSMQNTVNAICNRSADFKTKDITWGNKPMPRPERFEILFDAPGNVYFANEMVTGKVLLQIIEPLHLKGVKMRFKGECSIHFCERKIIHHNKKTKKGSGNKIRDIGRDMKEQKELSVTTNKKGGYCYSNGVDNPGYVPDEDQITESKFTNLNKFYDYSTMNGNIPKHRLKSTESFSNKGIMDGPIQHFQAVETYFDCEFYIYGHKYQSEERELLAVGTHCFPFAFNLPPNLPPSFSSEKGIIRYMAAAVLDRPLEDDLVLKTGFSIHAVNDLNHSPHASSSCNQSKVMNVCGLCCDTGPINVSMRISRKGYVPGETILVNAEVDNISGRYTKRTRLNLSQAITFIMPNKVKTHTEERVVREIVRGRLAPGDTDFWENVSIDIPPIAASNLHIHCRLMRLKYKLEMIVELPKPWKDLKVEIPIVIGNVPLRSSFSSFFPSSSVSRRAIPDVKYPNFPPFSYGPCFYGEQILDKQYELITGDSEYMGPQYIPETLFAPMYLVYSTERISRRPASGADGAGSSNS